VHSGASGCQSSKQIFGRKSQEVRRITTYIRYGFLKTWPRATATGATFAEKEIEVSKLQNLITATAMALALTAAAHATAYTWEPMYYKGATSGKCALQINKNPVDCDVVLFLLIKEQNNRVRIQYNNDDSGRMVIFEGHAQGPSHVEVSGVTFGTVAGQPQKVQFYKASGSCEAADGLSGCVVNTIDGKLIEAGVTNKNEVWR
jgi:hypothetical protein